MVQQDTAADFVQNMVQIGTLKLARIGSYG